MPIDELLAYFESLTGPRDEPASNLQFDDHGAFGSYCGLRLYSVFQAVFCAATLRPVAHEALLRARDQDKRAIPPAEAFKLVMNFLMTFSIVPRRANGTRAAQSFRNDTGLLAPGERQESVFGY